MSATAPSLYELVGERGVIVVPGLLDWLGLERPATEPEESYDDYLIRISEAASWPPATSPCSWRSSATSSPDSKPPSTANSQSTSC